MKYTKAKAPFELEKGNKAFIETYNQNHGEKVTNRVKSRALMVNALESDKMVLLNDVKALLPHASTGAILPRKFSINLSGITHLEIHPDMWDELIERGKIDKKGNSLMEIAAKPAPKTINADVNGDGKVDEEDLKAVEEAIEETQDDAFANEKTEESLDDDQSGDESNDGDTTDSQADA